MHYIASYRYHVQTLPEEGKVLGSSHTSSGGVWMSSCLPKLPDSVGSLASSLSPRRRHRPKIPNDKITKILPSITKGYRSPKMEVPYLVRFLQGWGYMLKACRNRIKDTPWEVLRIISFALREAVATS